MTRLLPMLAFLVVLVAAAAAAEANPDRNEQQATRIEALVQQLGSTDFAERQAADQALRQMPEAEAALENAAKSDDPEIAKRARSILEFIEAAREDPLLGQAITDEQRGPEDRPFWPLYQDRIADGELGQSTYNALLEAEAGLFALAWKATAPDLEAEVAAQRLGRFTEQSQKRWEQVADRLQQAVQKRIKARDFPYLRKPNRSTRTSIAAFYFLRGAVRESVPADLANQKKSLIYAFNPFKGADRQDRGPSQAWRACVSFGLQAARGDAELRSSLRVATFYRDWESARVLARRVARFDDLSHKTYFYAAHALVARGKGEQDKLAAYELLDVTSREKPASWGGRVVPNRTYLEIREIALQALLQMADRKPQEDPRLEMVQPTCPFARTVKMFYVEDTDQWPDIIEDWAARLDPDRDAR